MRQFFDRMPLRVRLVAVSTLLLVVGLAVAGFAATTTLRGYLVDRVDEQVAQAAPRFAGVGIGAPPPVGGEPDGHARLDRGGPSAFYATYLSTGGSVEFVATPQLGPGQAAPRVPPLTSADVDARGSRPFTLSAVSGGGRWRAVAVPAATGGSVVVALSLADVDHTVSRLETLELVIGASVVVVLCAVGYLLVRRSLQPLAEVETTAAAIAAGDLTQRVPDRHPRTEVGRLSAALNGMLAQIERAFRVQQDSEQAARRSEQQMRRFVADASHELRTPLTSIRGFAELFRQGAASDPAELARVLRRIEDEAARMGVLVDDLLLLARLDQHRPLEHKPVDLTVLARDAVADASVVAPDRRIDLVSEHPATVVSGDDMRLRQVLGNLVGNALTHTPAGTPVTVRVLQREDADGRWAVLEVADRGPGLAAEHADRIFERFYRADAARNRASGGTGLGLSIVAGIAEAHGGRVEVESAPGAGATFRVLLPLAGAAIHDGLATRSAGGTTG